MVFKKRFYKFVNNLLITLILKYINCMEGNYIAIKRQIL